MRRGSICLARTSPANMGKRGGKIARPAAMQMRAAAAKKRGGAGKKGEGVLDPDMYDEVDQFHSKRDKISLHSGAGDSDEDRDEDDEVEGVMDLPVSDPPMTLNMAMRKRAK